MFVNSCLFKVCFVWILAFFFFFFGLCNMFLFTFSFRVNIAKVHMSCLFCAALSSIVKIKKTLCYHMCFKKKKNGVQIFILFFFTLPLNTNCTRSCSGLKLCHRVALKRMRHAEAVSDKALPCWRRHLTLHMKTVLFHCLWVTCTFHSIIRCKTLWACKDESFLSFNKSVGPDWERERDVERGRERRRKGGHVWVCGRTALTNKSSGLHHSLSPRRSFVLKMLSPSLSLPPPLSFVITPFPI